MTNSDFPYQSDESIADAKASGHLPADFGQEQEQGQGQEQEQEQDGYTGPDAQAQEDQDGGDPIYQSTAKEDGMTPATPAP